jgi:hypothetical protein
VTPELTDKERVNLLGEIIRTLDAAEGLMRRAARMDPALNEIVFMRICDIQDQLLHDFESPYDELDGLEWSSVAQSKPQ